MTIASLVSDAIPVVRHYKNIEKAKENANKIKRKENEI